MTHSCHCRLSHNRSAADSSVSPLVQKQLQVDSDAYILPAPNHLFRHRKKSKDYLVYNPSSLKTPGHETISADFLITRPMKFFCQVITTPTADTPGTVIELNFPDKRYFFGQLSEGTQRACNDRAKKIGYLTDVFLTGRTEWKTTGGMIGMILTLADVTANAAAASEEHLRTKAEKAAMRAKEEAAKKKAKGKGNPSAAQQAETPVEHIGPHSIDGGDDAVQRGLTVHGPTNVMHTFATARRFVFRTGMPMFIREYDSETISGQIPVGVEDPFEKPTWSDHNIKVWAMPIKPHSKSGTFSQPRAQSPRKRSLEEFQETTQSDGPIDPRKQKQMMLQGVITDMFNSKWRMDALMETPLAQVKMPAAIFVRNPETKDLEPYKGPVPGDGNPLPDITVLVRQPWPGAMITSLPHTAPSDEALSYVVRSNDIRGKFDPKKALDLKVPKGEAYGRLTKGETVQSTDGQTITPDMVMGPARLGKGIAIMDIPSPEYVEGLISRPEWKSHAVTTELQAFLWILGPGVGEHPKLREFVASMPHCKHMVSSTDYCPNYLALGGAASSSIRLARLRGDNYSIPVHDNVTLPQPGTPTAGSETTIAGIRDSPFEPLAQGTIINVAPDFGVDNTEVREYFNAAKTIERIPRSVEQRMETTRRRVAKPAFQKQLQEFRRNLPGSDAEIITLGTGSSVPSKYRNVSSTLVHVPGYGYYLLDCGENTIGQLKRVFGPEQLREVLRNLRMIWISHLHADHHLGTVSVIKAWYEENYPEGTDPTALPESDMKKILEEKRLVVASEEMMVSWLEEYAGIENYGFDKIVPLAAYSKTDGSQISTQFTYRHCRADGTSADGDKSPKMTTMRFTDPNHPLTAPLQAATGLSDLLTTRVKHCKGAMAVSMVFPTGFKVSYSGDCRPSAKFAEIGRGSTVLIHEATFQDDMGGQARAKRHSTSAEALEVGRRMQARSILLTHFSQRYQKIATFDQRAGTAQDKARQGPVAVAREPADADIPFDDPEDNAAAAASSLTDDINISAQPRRRGSGSGDSLVPGVNVPVTVAFDYMRVKVGDLAQAQAYAPAVEKLFEIIDRVSVTETERNKRDRQEQDDAKKAAKNKKWTKGKKAAAAATVGAAVAVADVAQTEQVAEAAEKNWWSASESESGWETSEAEE